MWKDMNHSEDAHLGTGEKMLNPARNLLILPLTLSQRSLLSCCERKTSLLRYRHWWDEKRDKILRKQKKRIERKIKKREKDRECTVRKIKGDSIIMLSRTKRICSLSKVWIKVKEKFQKQLKKRNQDR